MHPSKGVHGSGSSPCQEWSAGVGARSVVDGAAGPARGVRRWCASAGPSTPAEAAAMPAHDGGRAHDDQSRRPVWPKAPQTNPEQPIRPARGGLGSAALIHGQLLPEGEVLKHDGTMSANEESDQRKSLHEPDDHGQR